VSRRSIQIFRRVAVSIWDALAGLPVESQLIYLRLATGPESQPIPGVTLVGRAALAEAIGWPAPRLERALRPLVSDGHIVVDWDRRVIWIPRAACDGAPDNPNVVTSWARYWSLIPICDLKRRIHRELFAQILPRGPTFLEAFGKACPDLDGNVPSKVGRNVAETGSGEERRAGGGDPRGGGDDPAKADAQLKRLFPREDGLAS
jgi:hypothetical protein